MTYGPGVPPAVTELDLQKLGPWAQSLDPASPVETRKGADFRNTEKGQDSKQNGLFLVQKKWFSTTNR